MKSLRTLAAAVALFLVSFDQAAACSVCFGAPDSPLVAGVNWSIFFMLALTYTVLGGFATFFLYLRKRERLFRGELKN